MVIGEPENHGEHGAHENRTVIVNRLIAEASALQAES